MSLLLTSDRFYKKNENRYYFLSSFSIFPQHLLFLALGFTVEQIAEALQLDIEQVKKIQNNQQ